MASFYNLISCIVLLLPTMGTWETDAPLGSSPILLRLASSPMGGDLLYCPLDFPSPAAPIFNSIDETALDEEDTDGEEDSTRFGSSAVFSYLFYAFPRYVSDPTLVPSSLGTRPQQLVVSPILRC